MINTITKLSLSFVVAVAIAACGGSDKTADTTPTTDQPMTKPATDPKPTTDTAKPTTDTAKPTADTAATGEPTCEAAVKHAMGIVVATGKMTQQQADSMAPTAVEKCKKENPSKEMLKCVMEAKQMADLPACDKKNKKAKPATSTPDSKPASK